MNTLLENDPALEDRRLVERHLAGDENAFREIVERHQTAVCAVAFSACGEAERSRDVAQEVFVAAWRRLAELREPEKLRPWLCGIARHRAQDAGRSDARTPTARASELSAEMPAEGGGPREQASSAEEAALMWRALEGMPEIYREPLVLFYRERGSTQSVAAALDVSEAVVRQRLTRGRIMLGERMAGIVEDALGRGGPGSEFTRAVLSALPVGVALGAVKGGAVTKAALAGGVGGAMVKGGLGVKALAVLGAVPLMLDGVLDYLAFRAEYDATGVGDERRKVVRRKFLAGPAMALATLAFVGVMFWLLVTFGETSPMVFTAAMIGFTVAVTGFSVWRRRRDVKREQASRVAGVRSASAFEYRSRRKLLGIPLLHVRAGGSKVGDWHVAKAWVAISDQSAMGVLFASGVIAVAPVSFGGLSVGLLTLGGGCAGLWAAGGVALGWLAAGGLAMGWVAADGTKAIAGEFARGQFATAPHADSWLSHQLNTTDPTVAAFMHDHVFFRTVEAAWPAFYWALWFSWVPAVVLIGWHQWRRSRRGGAAG